MGEIFSSKGDAFSRPLVYKLLNFANSIRGGGSGGSTGGKDLQGGVVALLVQGSGYFGNLNWD